MGYRVATGDDAMQRARRERSQGSRLYAVVATMGQGDEDAVAQLLAARPDYLGVVASPKRMVQVRDHLTGQGICGSRVADVHGPAGLDIGAESPEEVAVSILAEIVCPWGRERRGGRGGCRRAGDGPGRSGGHSRRRE